MEILKEALENLDRPELIVLKRMSAENRDQMKERAHEAIADFFHALAAVLDEELLDQEETLRRIEGDYFEDDGDDEWVDEF